MMNNAGKSAGGANAKRALWSDRIEQWKRSGKTQREFCAAHSLALSSFQWWRARLSRSQAPRSLFVPLPFSAQPPLVAHVIEVELHSGTRIRFEGEAARIAADRLIAKVR